MLEGASAGIGGLAAVAATYVSFLLWAQFGFVSLLRERLAAPLAPAGVHAAMLAMGVAGLAASLATGWLLRRVPALWLVRAGLASVSLAAIAALGCRSVPAFAAMAAVTGAATGLLTVALAAGLAAWVPTRHGGLALGCATGLAYLVCNVPAVFEAPPSAQALGVAVGCVAALLALAPLRTGAPRRASASVGRGAAVRLLPIVAAFLALVWIDSAAFAAIQARPDLAAHTWGTVDGKLLLGSAHLAAAVAAGALLDAGALLPLLAGTAGLFVVALPAIEAGVAGGPFWGVLYAAGISAYSTALVAFPSGLAGPTAGSWLPRRRAALLYGVAGWIGSALGVGMAEDLRRIPTIAVVAAAAVVWLGCRLARPRGPVDAAADALHRATALWGPTLVIAALLVVALEAAREPAVSREIGSEPAIARGRRVYVAEGCIQCHSQYVRPDPATGDAARWGPHRPVDRRERPPLIGTRRQGPDLTNVGARRSALWQRAHLIDPRAFDPRSRMPSYAHLFAAGRTEGDDLVAYLGSLRTAGGSGLSPQSDPADPLLPGPAEHARLATDPATAAAEGARLFARYCAVCHGANGRGDGPLAATLVSPAERRVMDLRKGPLWSVTRGVDGATPESARHDLERTILFGLPGTSMPGHESLPPEQVAALALHVETLASSGQGER